MNKIIYYSHDLRHKIILKSGRIETLLQRRHFMFFWEYIFGTNIHFEVRPDPVSVEPCEGKRLRIRLNPMRLTFQNMGLGSRPLYGELEIWDQSTFDLNRRLKEIAGDYLSSMRNTTEASNFLAQQINDL